MKTYRYILKNTVFLWLAGLLLWPAQVLAAPDDIALTSTAHNPPVVIQPTGGDFAYTVQVVNGGPDDETFDVWSVASLPDQSSDLVLNGPFSFLLPSGWQAEKLITQTVEGNLPEGQYTLTVNIGLYPDVVWHSTGFTFEKSSGGANTGWFSQNSGTGNYLTAVDFADASHGWAVGFRNTILRTTNGGDTWLAQTSPPSVNYWDVHAADINTAWAVGTSGKISYTNDGGATWTAQDSGTRNSLNGVFFLDSDTGWAVGGKERTFTAPVALVLHTNDGGQTWTQQYRKSEREPLQDIFFINPTTGWAVGGAGSIYRTDDGGDTWTVQNSGTGIGLNSVFFTDLNTGWAVGANGILLHTYNGGATWAAQDSGTTLGLADLFFTDTLTGWVVSGDVSSGLILSTNDGGNTWYPQENDAAGFLRGIVIVNGAYGWAVGYKGTIVHTASGGE